MRTILLKSLKHKARIAGQLSLLDWLAVLESWWVLLFFYFSLRWSSFERLSRSTPSYYDEISLSHASQWDSLQRLAYLVSLASRLHFLPMTCLVRALTLRWILGRRGIQSRLCIGANKRSTTSEVVLGTVPVLFGGPVDKSLNGIHAHAWVEVQGQVIGEPENIAGKFQLLASGRRTLPNSVGK